MRKCPRCGLSLITLELTRKVGCPFCYQFFRREILGIAQEMDIHGEILEEAPLEEALIRSLKEAVANEEYEEAAKIRDRINRSGQDVEPLSY